MAILTKSGRAAIAAAIKSQPLYLALGAGSPHWDTQFETTATLALSFGNILKFLSEQGNPVKYVTLRD